MRRRKFVILFGSAAAAWPLAAHAQPSVKLPTIGFLYVASLAQMGHVVAGFRRGLAEAGVIEGQNVTVEFRSAEGHYDRLAALAAGLVRHGVAVIVTGGGEPSAQAAKGATSTIPIVFSIGNDPVRAGLVASLSRPGGNLTGVNIFSTELDGKRLGLLDMVVPANLVIAHLVNPTYPPAATNIKEAEEASRLMGRKVLVANASTESEIDAAFAAMAQARVGAVHVGADPFFASQLDRIVALAARYNLPATYQQREFVQAGGLMSYGVDIADGYRQIGMYAGRILKGEKPADLPVVQVSKFQLVVNLRTAKALGLTLPAGLLSITDEVIE
jgi:putative ABC transport system substrate-binding protein